MHQKGLMANIKKKTDGNRIKKGELLIIKIDPE